MSYSELVLSKEVDATTEEKVSYVPNLGDTIWVECFHGDGAYQPNAVIRIEWDSVPIWTIKGTSRMPFKRKIEDGDGVKKLELILDNGESGALYMSGYAMINIV